MAGNRVSLLAKLAPEAEQVAKNNSNPTDWPGSFSKWANKNNIWTLQIDKA